MARHPTPPTESRPAWGDHTAEQPLAEQQPAPKEPTAVELAIGRALDKFQATGGMGLSGWNARGMLIELIVEEIEGDAKKAHETKDHGSS